MTAGLETAPLMRRISPTAPVEKFPFRGKSNRAVFNNSVLKSFSLEERDGPKKNDRSRRRYCPGDALHPSGALVHGSELKTKSLKALGEEG